VAETWSRRVPHFINAYGPAEATVCATLATIKGTAGKPPIGRPLSNVVVYLLDEQQQLVPVGVEGEIYIGGVGLARGYLNQPESTAERFIPNPFCTVAGGRLYRTGDRARWLTSGNIEYIGRRDGQVKMRGYRIELGEIEAILKEHVGVKSAVVALREDAPGDKRLVSYVVWAENQPGSLLTGELSHYIRKRLPYYMTPSAFVVLESLPLTPSGKIDRKALPAPSTFRPQLLVPYFAPRDGIETTIAGIWEEALGIKGVGVYDNFFELGGHSMLLVQIHAKLTEIFQDKITIVNLFEYPTIDSLVGFMTSGQTE
jgi:acyl-coenzyme A synthetase/AMP-(fatty) acid ligase